MCCLKKKTNKQIAMTHVIFSDPVCADQNVQILPFPVKICLLFKARLIRLKVCDTKEPENRGKPKMAIQFFPRK